MATQLLIGRTEDLEQVHSLIRRGERIITLWGPAGVGKTSLAHACAGLADGDLDATWFVDLTAVEELAGMVAAVADALGVDLPASGRRSIEHLACVISARGRVLIVLDNFEQIVGDAAVALRQWSELAPRATFLVTSREKLLLGPEVIHEVLPLDPSAASQLFVARAVAVGYRVMSEDSDAIEQVVRQLDCLPLAIELAAAQIPLLGPAELLTRLPELELFDGGRRDVDERHRTLRGALAWSWRLLDREEQLALAQISVFRGGFTLAAAEATLSCGAANVLPLLRSLHRRALVQARRTTAGDVRYSLLFELRAFAGEQLVKLARGGDESIGATRDRHAAYYAEAATRWAAEARGARGEERRRWLAAERDNLIDAHAHGVATDPTTALRIALALEPLLVSRGPLALLKQLVDDVLGVAGDVGAALLGRALCARAIAEHRLGDSGSALADFGRARELAREAGDRRLEALVLCEGARGVTELSNSTAAVVQLEAALALAVSVGDRDVECEVLTNLGYAMWYAGRFPEATEYYMRALPLAKASDDPALEGRIVASLAFLSLERGDPDHAIPALETARHLMRSAGDHRYAAVLTMDLAIGASEQGRVEDADALFAEALTALRDAGDAIGEGHCLANVGWEALRHRRGLAREHLERALAILEGACIGWAEGLICATLAALAAAEDRIDDAHTLVARARRGMETVTDPRLQDAARLHYLHLDLALARQARAAGDNARAEQLVTHVREHLAAEPTDPDRDRSDCRLARLLLERALVADEQARGGLDASFSMQDALLVAHEAMAFRVPGRPWVDLSRHKVLRRILTALVHREHLTVEELLREAWPDERVSPSAGASRVHVGVATLRRLGLRSVLVRGPQGYYLDRRVPIVADVAPPAPAL